jgi:hypothetical protein
LEGTIEKKKLLLHWKLKATLILKQFFLAKTTLILKRREYYLMYIVVFRRRVRMKCFFLVMLSVVFINGGLIEKVI